MKRYISKLVSTSIFFLILLLSIPGCNTSLELSEGDSYNFMSYNETNDIVSIEEIELDSSLKNECRSYEFTYKVDGNTVIGYIGIPTDCLKSKTPYPCTVFNRGGNRDYSMLEKQDAAYLCSQLETIVIASQYRGSTDSSGSDEFGGADVNDVLKLIDICENLEFVNMDKLYAVGASRGGMMSYIAARQDERIKKLVVISGIADLVSTYNERDDMKEMLEELVGGSPEEMPNEYEKRSAINWANEIEIPVLVIHSKNDKKVSFYQGQTMAELLKQNEKDCSFVSYDDDIHGLHQDDPAIIKKWLNGENITKK